MMAKAVRRGMATGLVVTCYLPHATPGAFYAHQVYRRTLQNRSPNELVESGVDVAFGGGKRYFTARRADGTTLVDRLRTKGYRVIDTLAAADTITSGKVVGLFASKHMPYAHKGRGDYLPRAVGKALEILSNDAAERDEGFMLVVEGSMIDYVSHRNDSEGILAEMRDFDRAVRVAMEYVDAPSGDAARRYGRPRNGRSDVAERQCRFHEVPRAACCINTARKAIRPSWFPSDLDGPGAERINGVMENSDLANRLMEILERE